MNRAQVLAALLEDSLPMGASVEITNAAPDHEDPSWFIDVRFKGRTIVIEWRESVGFGVTSLDGDNEFASGSHEYYSKLNQAADRVVHLLLTGEQTRTPTEETLRSLREEQGLSQVQLASLLGITQASLSKMERRADMNLSTLRRVVEGLGGNLLVQAEFPDRTVPLSLFEESSSKKAKAG